MDINENYMKNQFCSYEIAFKLKELGFSEQCLASYTLSDKSLTLYDTYVNWNTKYSLYCSAPLWQQVIDWFREEYGLEIAITSWENNIIPGRSESISYILYSGANFKYNIYKYNPWHIFDSKYIFNTYHKAREQAILKAIEIINERDI